MTGPLVRDGMGATPHDTGVAFRVWAPHADEVFVVGSFNDWAEDVAPMAREDDGTWYVDLADAKPGDEYRFLIRNGAARRPLAPLVPVPERTMATAQLP